MRQHGEVSLCSVNEKENKGGSTAETREVGGAGGRQAWSWAGRIFSPALAGNMREKVGRQAEVDRWAQAGEAPTLRGAVAQQPLEVCRLVVRHVQALVRPGLHMK